MDRKFVENQTCDGRRAYADGCCCTGKEAFMVMEYGGIAFANIGIQGQLGGMETWGYHGKEADEESFFRRYQECTEAILEAPAEIKSKSGVNDSERAAAFGEEIS